MSIELITKGRISNPESTMTNGVVRKAGVFIILEALYTFVRSAIPVYTVAKRGVFIASAIAGKTTEYAQRTVEFVRKKVQ